MAPQDALPPALARPQSRGKEWRDLRARGRLPSGRGGMMIEAKERKPYWRHTKWQMVASLAPFLLVIVILPLYAERLNTSRFLGFPLGYFLCAHGTFFVAVVTVASFVNRQDAIDHWHGAHEDI
jgi:putative solute:sodium symporter small subunit